MRFLVTKPQLWGTRWQRSRVEKAMIRRDTKDLETPHRNQSMGIASGAAAIVLMCVVGFIVAKISPQSSQHEAKFIVVGAGSPYVEYGGALHPVLNLASARLILGTPVSAKPVKDSVLETRPRGQTIGILFGAEMLTPRLDDTARWTVCDTHTASLSLTVAHPVTTTLIAGQSDLVGQKELAGPTAVAVRDPDTAGQVWVLWGNRRATVSGDDKAAQTVLGLTPAVMGKAAPISRGLLNAITSAPPITSPFIVDRGLPSATVAGLKNGDIVRTKSVTGSDVFTVVFGDGVQQIPTFVADLLAATGSTVTTTPTTDLIKAPRVQHIDVDSFPPQAPVYVQSPVMCWTWERGANDAAATTKLTIGDQLPIPSNAAPQTVPQLDATGIEQAQQAFTSPGKGWYARVTGDGRSSEAREQLLWIDDKGVRYALGLDGTSYDGTVAALGINTKPPLLIPWSIAKLYAQGPTLSKTNALVLHENSGVDLGQKSAPKPEKN
ncbi:type VII secretion protein EccB (plasmid) [Mycolicibacterium sp. TY66]|uniref:type VII secretion protein EccB n=1 Tax=unclassified Mycolicibacterium TaxID=2636767 RepID=UPI001BB33223|nr:MULTISPECIES: type VII secretion protein EccB [unclassified Mycolicibacterium]BCI84640.1 type VII secretion protein EccB [Mycolicibacterium sp. TY66]BCJ84870.1 type VII secretion protein EccB [Mycolicibacterium sp. TY81]